MQAKKTVQCLWSSDYCYRLLDLHLHFKCSNTGKADFEILAAKYHMADRINVAS